MFKFSWNPFSLKNLSEKERSNYKWTMKKLWIKNLLNLQNLYSVKPHLSARPWNVNTSLIGISRGSPLPPSVSWWESHHAFTLPHFMSLCTRSGGWRRNKSPDKWGCEIPIGEDPDKWGFTVTRLCETLK